MNFRRLPFQFTTTDPAERQRELERRFGLPTNRDMYVDAVNPLSMGSLPRESNPSASSPRLQHRVPIFVDGYDQPIHSSVDSTAPTSENKKPNVRVIPIEVEGADNRSARHRTFSGPARTTNGHGDECLPQVNASSPLKRSVEDFSKSSASGPRVHTIPIQVESSNKSTKIPKFEKSASETSPVNQINRCDTVSKTSSKSSVEVDRESEGPPNVIEKSLNQIESVLEQLKIYEDDVQRFSGTMKEKRYRYLDEMLTQCMIRLDDVDTMGNDNVRSARKNAVKKIQAQLDLLERKANAAVSSVPENSIGKETAESQELEEVTRVESREEAPTSPDSSPETQELEEVKRDSSKNDVGMEHDSNPETSKNIEMAQPNDGDLVQTSQGTESPSTDLVSLNASIGVANESGEVNESVGGQILNATLEDAEMKDIQSTTSVDAEDNSCCSQLEDNCELDDVNMEESFDSNIDIVASQGAVKEETASSDRSSSIKE